MGERHVRTAVVAINFAAGLLAVAGAVGLIGGGIPLPLSLLRGTPFTDYTVPGLILGIVVGGSALAAGLIALLGRRPADALASVAAGAIMVGWIAGEYILLGYISWMQPACAALGLVMLGLGALLWGSEARATQPAGERRRAA
jgi:hypothetical protein